jgi:hypothetical protein
MEYVVQDQGVGGAEVDTLIVNIDDAISPEAGAE